MTGDPTETYTGSTRVKVMGIVNATPDSFSGDGLEGQAAIERGLKLARAGADFVDVGGESTRPGHVPVDIKVEIGRAIPVVRALAAAGIAVSIDTSKLEVAAAAVRAGARMINDQWGLVRSPGIGGLAAESGVALVLMHNQEGHLYAEDIMSAIKRSLGHSITAARSAGISAAKIIVDPGIGFGKTADQNVEVLRRLTELHELGYPILVGASRKGFLGRLYGQEMEMRAWGTAAVVTACILRGVQIVRVHDVAEMVAVARVAEGLKVEPRVAG